jgi:hypothetical protein
MSNLKSTVSIQTDFVTPIEVRGEEISVPEVKFFLSRLTCRSINEDSYTMFSVPQVLIY